MPLPTPGGTEPRADMNESEHRRCQHDSANVCSSTDLPGSNQYEISPESMPKETQRENLTPIANRSPCSGAEDMKRTERMRFRFLGKKGRHTQESTQKDEKPREDFKRGPQFWLIYLSVALVCFASALDTTIISTALPTITHAVGGSDKYVWIANCFTIAQTAIQPFFGQICNIFGRRWPMIACMALFLIGTGVAGGATNPATLIIGRTILGLGSGGIFMMGDLITCDLVPQRYRGKYLGLVLSTAAVGSLLGPLIGGALAEKNWRWVFWMNLPIGGVAIALLFLFLRMKYPIQDDWNHAVARMDLLGNTLFIVSITAILFGLIAGGTTYPWNTYHIIIPIVIGALGWIGFHIQQSFVPEPTVPNRLFTNRTSLAGFIIAFDSSILVQWVTYFLPVYFQSALGKSPTGSGVALLPTNAFLVPSSIIAGSIMSKTGHYRFMHFISFALLSIAFGLFTLLDQNSSKAEWVCFQIIAALGFGPPISTVLPSLQASLPESDVATATATYQFVRSFGFLWGITIPSIIFNNIINRKVLSLSDQSLIAQIINGGAYGFIVGGQIRKQNPLVQQELLDIYIDALKRVWQIGLAFTILGFLAVFLSKHVALREELDNEYGLDNETNKKTDTEGGSEIPEKNQS